MGCVQLDESQTIIALAKVGCNSSHQLQNLAAHVLVDQSKGEKGNKGHQGRKGPKGGNRCQRTKRAKRWYFLAKVISCPPCAKGEGRAWDNSGKGPGKPMVFQVSDVDVQLQVLASTQSDCLRVNGKSKRAMCIVEVGEAQDGSSQDGSSQLCFT